MDMDNGVKLPEGVWVLGGGGQRVKNGDNCNTINKYNKKEKNVLGENTK